MSEDDLTHIPTSTLENGDRLDGLDCNDMQIFNIDVSHPSFLHIP